VGNLSDPPTPGHGPPPRLMGGLTPAAGAAVMSTGILSTATQFAGLSVLSRALLVLAVLTELALGVVLVSRLFTDRRGWLADRRGYLIATPLHRRAACALDPEDRQRLPLAATLVGEHPVSDAEGALSSGRDPVAS
jgi:hypothetical protein